DLVPDGKWDDPCLRGCERRRQCENRERQPSGKRERSCKQLHVNPPFGMDLGGTVRRSPTERAPKHESIPMSARPAITLPRADMRGCHGFGEPHRPEDRLM